MMRILGSKGSLRIVKREYVRYRVSPTRLSPKPRNVEFVVITDTNGKPESIESLKEIVSELHRIDSEIPESEELLSNGQITLDNFQSDRPTIESRKEKRSSYKCSNCGEKGHNSRTCKN